ncbi:MAG: hypothetical protein Q4F88_06510 [Eubacteriales bacterium]|nr:hypothetical protein [Eubacteriales bacterium]
MKKFKKILYSIITGKSIYIIIFILATVIYTLNSFLILRNEYQNFSSIEESKLPRLYMYAGEERINQLRAYNGDNVEGVANETLTIIPEDRILKVDIFDITNNINSINYEVRDKYSDALIERTQVGYIDKKDNFSQIILRIQNLIGRDQEYLLKIHLETGETSLYYYTTIVWLSESKVNDMINLAKDFVVKSFDYNEARSLIIYLERNDNADQNQLNEITLASQYSQITWEDTKMALASDIEYTLLDAKTYCYIINAEYITRSPNTQGNFDYYFNTNQYVFRFMDNKISVMKYTRTTEEYLDEKNLKIKDNKMYLGITNISKVKVVQSSDERYKAFTKQKEVFLYDEQNITLTKAFSFKDNEIKNFKNIYNKYDIKVLSVNEQGTIKILVYGYMNRGRDEGQIGVAIYSYNTMDNALYEDLFVPVYSFYEDMRCDIERLAYLNQKNILYIYFNNSIYAIDIDNKDMNIIVDNIINDQLTISFDQRFVSWEIKENDVTKSISIFDNEKDYQQIINANANEKIMTCGFVYTDLCYGIGEEGDIWFCNDRKIMDMVHTLRFFNALTGEQRSYVDETYYFQDFESFDNRIQYKKFIKEDKNYIVDTTDIIINTQFEEMKSLQNIKSEIDSIKKRIYYFEAKEKNINSIKVILPDLVSYQTVELANSKISLQTNYYYSYDNEKLVSKSLRLQKAVRDCRLKFGFVKYKGRTIWNRSNKPAYVFLKMPIEKQSDYTEELETLTNQIIEQDVFILFDASLMIPNDVEYYLAQHMPVTIFFKDGTYTMITSYNGKIYRTYNPIKKERIDLTYEDMNKLLKENGSNIVVALQKSRF